MSELLDEIQARLNWVRGEIEALDSEVEIWFLQNFTITYEPDEIAGYRGVVVTAIASVPISIRAKSGTLANELRSCLDSLASALAQRNSHEDAYFPVAQTEDAFTSDTRFIKRLRRFRDSDRDELLAFRPFALGLDGKPGNLLIYGLHHTDIRRKHHRLVAKAAGASLTLIQGYIGHFEGEGRKVALPGKTRIGRLSEDSYGDIIFKPTLLYAEPDVLCGCGLIKTLNDFADAVDAIVLHFASKS